MKPCLNTDKIFVFTLLCFFVNNVSAQQIAVNPRSYMVMNGSPSLVLNSASFINNGNFTAAAGTVKFTGYTDTSYCNLDGANNTTFYNLSIQKNAFGVVLRSDAAVRNILSVTGGTLFTDSNLTLKSDQYLTARVAAITGTGNIIGKTKVERYITAKRAWRILTAPLTSSNTIFDTWQNGGIYEEGKNIFITGASPSPGNGLDSSLQNNSSMKTWNSSTQQFVTITNTYTPISAGTYGSADNTAYFTFVRGDRTKANLNTNSCNVTTLVATGKLQIGDQTFNTSGALGAYSMIGNPYASPVDFSKLTRFNTINRFYVWDPTLNTLGGYVMLDDLGNSGTYTKSVSASAQTKEIQSGQGILVQTQSAGAASITFKEADKETYNNQAVFRPAITTTSQMLRVSFNIINSDNSILPADGTFAEYNQAFSNGLDMDDAVKFSNMNEGIALARNNRSLAAERRGLISQYDTLFLKLSKTTARNYQFEITPTGFISTEIRIHDSFLDTYTALNPSGTTVFNFNIDNDPASADANRFKILFRKNNTLPVTVSSIKTSLQNNNPVVEWKVENEINIDRYEVQKSTDGIRFSSSGFITARGNAVYTWADAVPLYGACFYRIKIYDRSGEITYSSIVKASIIKPVESNINIYPNPVRYNTINLQLINQQKGVYKLKLSNIAGQLIYKGNVSTDFGNGTVSVKINTGLNTGIYQLEIITPDNNKESRKVIVE
ncbi:MAG: T9SS type A sorting domain-containing protein [Ferruginibacter sp.]